MPVIQKDGPQTFTTGDTRANHTGSWRYMKPVFEEKNAPCKEACPIGNPIAKCMTLVTLGREREALGAILEENPLPGVCGRVCPHPCITACNRAGFDEALLVNEVERFLGDQAAKPDFRFPDPKAPTGKHIAVIGSGPAGLSVAYHSALLGHRVTVYEKEARPGGLLRFGIPTYRLPREVLDRDLRFIEQLHIELVTNSPVDREQYETLLTTCDAVCVAVGAQKSYRLAVKGETAAGVIPGLDFLKSMHLGAAKKPGARTVVVGGGNTAMDAARCARRLGSKVTVLYRRSREDMPAIVNEIEEAVEEGVEFKFFAAPVEIQSHDRRVGSVRCIEMRPGEPDDSGRQRPEPIPGSAFTIDADTVITAVGESVTLPFFELSDKAGSAPLEIDSFGGTAEQKLFVCGDAGPNTRTVAHAIGSGKHTAMAIHAFLGGNPLPSQAEKPLSMAAYRKGQMGSFATVAAEAINLDYFTEASAPTVAKSAVADRLKGFEEIRSTLDATAVNAEAARCFSCGVCNHCRTCFLFCPDMSVVLSNSEALPDFVGNYCKGCGICARECPRAIIKMVEEQK